MAVVTQIQVRRGTAAQWTSANPTLSAGEWGYETDTGKAKIGNGSTAWSSLSYFGGAGTVTSITAGTGLSGGTITGSGTIAIDTATTVDLSTAQTLTNKTLTTPTITQGQSTPSFSANAYTLVAGDAGKLLLASNSSTAGTVYVPTNGSVAFATGTQITVLQTGSGQLTISATTPATTTINSTGATAASPKCRAQYSAITLIKTATDTWYAMGDIS
jgi:hypothetical protein